MKALNAVSVAAALLMAGGASRGDIFHSGDLAPGSSVTIDAQQLARRDAVDATLRLALQ